MRAYIMAAGVGTRLEPLTLAVPKPMVPICNIPVMEYNLRLLKKYGIRKLTANLHYFPEQIEDFFGNGHSLGMDLTYSYEEELLGTAGGVKRMAQLSGDSEKTAVVLSADVLTDMDLGKLIRFHKKKKAAATIGLMEVDDPSSFGVVVTDEGGRIVSFQEKPDRRKALGRKVNTGIYVLEKEVIDMIPPDSFYDFGKQLFPLLIENKIPFYGLLTRSYWKDIGSVGNYVTANFDILNDKSRVLLGKNCRVSKSARLCGDVIMGKDCVVEGGAVIKDSIIWPNTQVGEGARIESSVIGEFCVIGARSKIGSNSVIANRNKIGPGADLAKMSIIPPAGNS